MCQHFSMRIIELECLFNLSSLLHVTRRTSEFWILKLSFDLSMSIISAALNQFKRQTRNDVFVRLQGTVLMFADHITSNSGSEISA